MGHDLAFLAALLPQHRAPLYWHVLRYGASHNEGKATAVEPLLSVLRTLLDPGAAFDESATLLLAVGLIYTAPLCRALAMEVWLAAIERRQLLPTALGQALGRLLAAGFAPVQRLAAAAEQFRALGPAAADALRQTLEALLPELPTPPPRDTRKLLEAYAGCLSRTRPPVSAAVRTVLLG